MAFFASHGLPAFCVLLALGTGNCQMNQEQKDAVLNLHNKLRGQKHANQPCVATDMLKLTWDDTLASESQAYANQCLGDHALGANQGKFGENLYMDIHETTFTTAKLTSYAQGWYDEVIDTDWAWGAKAVKSKPLGQCPGRYAGSVCNVGHYYQVIWAKASKLGCGVAACPNLKASGQEWGKAIYMVCRYDKAAQHLKGATMGLPYQPGKPCAGCPNSCSDGLCTAAPTRCVDSSSACSNVNKSDSKSVAQYCAGAAADVCAKSCGKCTPPSGAGYDKCQGYSPSLVTTTTPGAAPCALPAGPLNSYWDCRTKDGCKSIDPVDVGFFMYSIAFDPNITCVAKCQAFNKGPLGTGQAIRYVTPKDRVGIAKTCDQPGKKLTYDSQAPKTLLDADKWLLNYCEPIEECELPSLKNTSGWADPNAYFDPTSCTISPATPAETSGRFLKGETCKIKCKAGYEIDKRYAQETGTCGYGSKVGTDKAKILGSVGPPTFKKPVGGYSLPPVCVKVVTSGWLDADAGKKCMNNPDIPADYKKSEGCPTGCTGSDSGVMKTRNDKVRGYGTDAKQKIVQQCKLMSGYDNKYTLYHQGYCCCARAECFAGTGKLKTAEENNQELGGRRMAATTATTTIMNRKCCYVPHKCPAKSASPPGSAKVASSGNKVPKTTTTTLTSLGQAMVVTGATKLKFASIPANFTTDPKVKESLQTAIADTIPGVKKEYVTILNISTSRRLHIATSSSRRLAGDVTVEYEIKLPATYTGGQITTKSIDAGKLKTNINTNLKKIGVAAVVENVEVLPVKSVMVPKKTLPKVGAASAARSIHSPSLLAALVYILGAFGVLGMSPSCKFAF